MDTEREIVDITPDRSLITKMGQASHYSEWQALSELIDNSIDARVNEIKEPVEISIQFETGGGTFLFGNEGEYDIEVSDNGKGMTFNEFSTCLKLAYVDKNKDKKIRLGKFGLGLKTSISSLGSKFKIISKPYKGNERYSLVFDEKEFIEHGEWAKFRIVKEKDASDWHGTIIKIKSRKEVKIYKEKINRIKEKFGLQYAYLIQNNIVKIQVNTQHVKPTEPELEKDPELAPDGKYKIDFTLSTGQHVTGWVGFRTLGLKNTGVVSQLNYGFHIYWRQRLIAEYEKVGIRVHTELQRVIGELHLDEFPVTHDKTNIVRDSKEYDALAGPRKKDDPESREYTQGELWKVISHIIAQFEKKQEERRKLYRVVDDAVEKTAISLGTGRKIKNQIKKREIAPETVAKIIQEEAKRTQEKVGSYLNGRRDDGRASTQTVSVGSSHGKLESVSYNPSNHSLEGYSLYYKRCNPEEADLIVVRGSDRRVKKYLDGDRKEVTLPQFFEEQD